jgi:hypothetical protein
VLRRGEGLGEVGCVYLVYSRIPMVWEKMRTHSAAAMCPEWQERKSYRRRLRRDTGGGADAVLLDYVGCKLGDIL